jgi:DNA-binding HxlR family transcriptional regulator
VRAGGQTLTLLAAPRIYLILKSLAEGTKSQVELRRDAGSPAQSTLRGHLVSLEEAGVVERRRREEFPGTVEYDLTEAGRDLLIVAECVERWLSMAPSGQLELGSDPARAAIKGLVDGWSATVLSALADGPLSLTELDRRITAANYPTLERCLDTMRLTELLEIGERSNKGTPYELTEWLRRGLTPLAIAARWEHHHRPKGCDPVCRGDVDDAVLIGGPLFRLSGRLNGLCQLAVRIPNGKRKERPLAFLEIRDGKVSFGGVYPEVKPDAWASGTADSWFATVIDAETDGLRMSGDRKLTTAVIGGFHEALFGPEAKPQGLSGESQPFPK